MAKKDLDEQIDFLEDFIKRWEKIGRDEKTRGAEGVFDPLIDEYAVFIKENELPNMSADELLCELLDKLRDE